MAATINIASVISVESEGVSGLFVVDSHTGRVHRLAVSESDPVEAGRVMMAVRGQMRDNTFDIPYGDIADVMRAEREVSDAGHKVVSEEDKNARG